MIEILAPQSIIPIYRFNFENTIAKLKNRDVKRPATEVIYGNCSSDAPLFEPIRKCGRRWLRNDKSRPYSCYLSGVNCCLYLAHIEISRHGKNCLCNLLVEICLRCRRTSASMIAVISVGV